MNRGCDVVMVPNRVRWSRDDLNPYLNSFRQDQRLLIAGRGIILDVLLLHVFKHRNRRACSSSCLIDILQIECFDLQGPSRRWHGVPTYIEEAGMIGVVVRVLFFSKDQERGGGCVGAIKRWW